MTTDGDVEEADDGADGGKADTRAGDDLRGTVADDAAEEPGDECAQKGQEYGSD